jgi:hypothetical protein
MNLNKHTKILFAAHHLKLIKIWKISSFILLFFKAFLSLYHFVDINISYIKLRIIK